METEYGIFEKTDFPIKNIFEKLLILWGMKITFLQCFSKSVSAKLISCTKFLSASLNKQIRYTSWYLQSSFNKFLLLCNAPYPVSGYSKKCEIHNIPITNQREEWSERL